MNSSFAALLRRCALPALLAPVALAQHCGMIDLGTLGGPGSLSSLAYAVSADGSVVVGKSHNSAGQFRAFQWTPASGMRQLGTLANIQSLASGVSADGIVIIGSIYVNFATYAFRWTQSSDYTNLGTFGGVYSESRGISADGRTIVGWAYDAMDDYRAFRQLDADPLQDLGTLPDWAESIALAISGDGLVTVGWSNNDVTGPGHAFLWTSSQGMRDLGTLGGASSAAQGASMHAEVIVGWAENAAGRHRACRWTAPNTIQDLGTLGGLNAEALGISADATTIVGWAEDAARNRRAFRWTANEGMQDLGTLGGLTAAASGVSADGSVVVGWADNGSQYHAFRWAIDSDGDGIPDDWECNGIPYTDAAGQPQRYILPGANPRHKDVYVELDALSGQMISPAARQMVVGAFANAPVHNPDGIDGIALHLDAGEDAIASSATWTADARAWANEFDALKASHFGSGSSSEQRAARAKAYRYAICADRIDSHVLGGAERPGNDFFTTLGELGHPATDEEQAAIFMHELGHTLGLQHGGGDSVVAKPNYASVMNHVLCVPLPYSREFWRLDYSRETLATLNEAAMDESVGVASAMYRRFRMPYGVGDGQGGRLIRYVRLSGVPTDWNGNSTRSDASAMQDLNFFGGGAPFAGVGSPSASQVMAGFDDWAHVQLGIGHGGDFVDGIHESVPHDEITGALAAWMQSALVGGCVADVDDGSTTGTPDGGVTIEDLLYYLGLFEDGTIDADLDDGSDTGEPDGGVTIEDLLYYLARYAAGC